MSASIRIKIMGGTSIEEAYENCAAASMRLGGMSVETNFNGVEMFYHGQTKSQWDDEYRMRIYGPSNEEGDAK